MREEAVEVDMKRYSTVAVGIDFSPLSTIALEAAAHEAARLAARRLHLVHVFEHRPFLPMAPFGLAGERLEEAWRTAKAGAEQRLDAVEIPEPGRALWTTREVRLGSAAEELVEATEGVQADLLVLASHDRTPVQRVILGSVASALLRAAHCPIMVVGADRPGTGEIRTILAAVDLSPSAEPVLRHAMALAHAHEAKLHILTIYDVPTVVPGLDELLPRYLSPEEVADIPAKYQHAFEALVERIRLPNVEVDIDVSAESPAHATILGVAAERRPDLIVLGTSGHNAFQRFFLGSTATRVVAEAHCPVLVVPREPARAKQPEVKPAGVPSIVPAR
jgi:nucleotide-binding universal stress UspA family protein